MKLTTVSSARAVAAIAALAAAAGCASAGGGSPEAEARAITQAEVERLEITLAHDSMEGRQVGTPGAAKASAFIAAEMRRLGLEPAGDNGTYLQSVRGTAQYQYAASTMNVDGEALRWNSEFTATPTAAPPRPINGAQVIFGGVTGDTLNTITAEQANGRVVVLLPAPPRAPGAGRGGAGRVGGPPPVNKLAGAVAVITVNLDSVTTAAMQRITTPSNATSPRTPPPAAPAQIRITTAAATKLFGGATLASLAPGKTGGTVTANINHVVIPQPTWTRNVIGVMRGSDPKLKDEWVLIDAHYDHLGVRPGAAGADSIYNGADDDASGVVAVLEIARALKAGKAPKRSIIFAAMTGEEAGLIGTNYYIANPFVPLSKLVSNLEIEMIGRPDSLSDGRGGAWLTGYERSTMGDMLKERGIRIFPDKRPSQNFFSRSDNRAFACAGIPAHTLSTFNLHTDYHRASDESNKIDFVHMTEVIRSGAAAARILADGPAPQWVPGGSPVGTSICPAPRAPGT